MSDENFREKLIKKDEAFYDEFTKAFLESIGIITPTLKQILLTKKMLSQAWVRLPIHIDDRLTEMEKKCLALFYRGFSLKEVADFLKVALKTVQNHRDSIFQKLFSKNLREAIKEGVRYRLIDS
jgi:DNA-binding CsgD family transcriptional regulator